MPIPKPRTDDTQSEYMQRCMSWLDDNEELPHDQMVAICMQQWRDRNKLAVQRALGRWDD